MRKLAPIKEPVVAATFEQYSQRVRDEKNAYRDMFNSVSAQLNTYSDMAAHGGSILEDLKTWEIILQNKTIQPHTIDIVRTSLQFQHSLNVAFGRLSTSLTATVASKADFYSRDVKEGKDRESKIKDDKEILRLMQESEDRYIAMLENYWKCYVEFFRQGYQLGVMIKNFFVRLHPEDPVLIEVPKAFGKDLAKIWEDDSELRIVIYILKYFEEYGSLEENVFKNNVNPDSVKNIIQALEKGSVPLTGSTEAMAHVVLHWVNSLTEPVFTFSLQKDFLDVANMVNMQVKKEKMSNLLGKLPRPNRIVLMALLRGCVKIAREKSVGTLRYTQILLEKIADLAAALGPSLVRCSPEQVALSLSLLRYLILNSELFFPLGCEEERFFVTETLKLGRILKLTPELAPLPTAPLTPPLSPSSTSLPSSLTATTPPTPTFGPLSFPTSPEPKGLMKIGERNSSKNNFTAAPAPPSPSFANDFPTLSHSSSSPSLPVRTVGFQEKEPPPPVPKRTYVPSIPAISLSSSIPPLQNPPPSSPSTALSSSAPTTLTTSLSASLTSSFSLSTIDEEDPSISVTNNNNNSTTTSNTTNINVDVLRSSPPSFPASTSPIPSNSPTPSFPASTSPIPSSRGTSGIGIGARAGLQPSGSSNPAISGTVPLLSPVTRTPSPTITPPTTPRKVGINQKTTSDELQGVVTNYDESESPRIELGPLGAAQITPRVELTGPAQTQSQTQALATTQEGVQKLARDIIAKIEIIKTRAEQTDVFEEAFNLVLKLKIITQDVEAVKAQLHMGIDFDKSELAKARPTKLDRVRATVQIFSREVIFVMETVCSIFGTSDVAQETRSAVAASLTRVFSQLASVQV